MAAPRILLVAAFAATAACCARATPAPPRLPDDKPTSAVVEPAPRPPVEIVTPDLPLDAQPSERMWSGASPVLLDEEGNEVPEGAVVRVTRGLWTSYRATVVRLPDRLSWLKTVNGETGLTEQREPGGFVLEPFPQDVEAAAFARDDEPIRVTRLFPIPGSPDIPRRGGVSDVAPQTGRPLR